MYTYPLRWRMLVCLLWAPFAALAQSIYQPVWQVPASLPGNLPPSVQVFESFTPLIDAQGDTLPMHVVYTVADLNDPNISLQAAAGPTGSTFQTPLAWAQAQSDPVFVAVNGGFFSSTQSVSLIVRNGQVITPNIKALSRLFNDVPTTYYPTRSAFGIRPDGTPDVAWVYSLGDTNLTYAYPQPSPNAEGTAPQPQPSPAFPAGGAPWNVRTALGGGPVLVRDSMVMVATVPEMLDPNAAGREPRTAVGYTSDNRVVMLVVDGRQPEFSRGMTLAEVAEVLRGLGVTQGMNLDGGGSSAMVAGAQVISSPSDAGGVLRNVPSALLLMRQNQTYDTETPFYSEVGGGWFETANPGFFGPSRARLVATGDGSAKGIYTFAGLPPAEYELGAWWVPAGNRSPNTPYTVIRTGLTANDTVRLNQTQAATANQFNAVGTYHLGPGDSVVVSNDATGQFVTLDAIQLRKVGESLPAIALTGAVPGDFVQGSTLNLTANVQSPNTGVTLQTLRIFKTVGDSAEVPVGAPVDLSGLADSSAFNYVLSDPLGALTLRFEVTDSFGRTVSESFAIQIKSFSITFDPDQTEGQHPNRQDLTFDVIMDTESSTLTLSRLDVFRTLNDGPEMPLDTNVTLSQSQETYNFSYFIDEPATSRLTFRFAVTAANGETSDKTYRARVLPARGDKRVVVVSDFNSAFGSTNYEWQVDSIIQRIPRLWEPDFVICGGDMVAGQSTALTEAQLQAMWVGFDQVVGAPLRQSEVPFIFTIGNHDGAKSGGFALERQITAEYWQDTTHFPGWFPIDTATNYPFYFSCMEKENGDFFIVSWDASTALIDSTQLAWLAGEFARPEAQAAKYRLVVGHMPFYGVAQERDSPGNVLANPESLRQLLIDYDVHTYISGHHHAYYLGKRGGIDLLNAGAAGSGPRAWLNTDRRSPNTATLMDFFYDEDTVIYTTYEIRELIAENMPRFEDRSLPLFFAGVNGFIIRRDVDVTAEAAGTLSPYHLVETRPDSASGTITTMPMGDSIEVSGTFAGLTSPLLEDRAAIGIYRGAHTEEGSLFRACAVQSADGLSGTFRVRFPMDSEFRELLSVGAFHVRVRTEAFPEGEIRAQLYPADNEAPTAAQLPMGDSIIAVRDIPALLSLTWRPSADPENVAVTYTLQVSADTTFEELLLHAPTNRQTEFKGLTESDWYALLEAPVGDTVTLFQRVISSDGKHVIVSEVRPLRLRKSDEPVDGAIEIPAPEYVYDDVVTTTPLVNGHGVTVDASGRVWSVAFSAGMRIVNPDGTPYFLSSDKIVYNNGDTTSYVRRFVWNNDTIPLSNPRGIGIAHDGHILLVNNNSRVFKFDRFTGEPLARWDGPTSFTNPSSDSAGNVFVASVVGNRNFIIRQNEADSTTYDVVVGGQDLNDDGQPDGFLLPGRELARSSFISPEGDRLYVPANSGRNVHVYRLGLSTDSLPYMPDTVIQTTSPTGCNSVFAGPNQTVWFVANRGASPPNLIYRDFANNFSWSYFLEDVPSSDLRGLSFTADRDTFYVVSSVGAGQVTRYYLPNDSLPEPTVDTIPAYRIAQVRGVNARGMADSLGVYCQLNGVVNSDNFRQNGFDFSLVDGDYGIQVVNRNEAATYTVTRGDSVAVFGRIAQAYGWLQLRADSVIIFPATTAQTAPRPFTALADSLESFPIVQSRVRLLDPTEWTTGQGYHGFGVRVANEAATDTFTVFVNRQTTAYNLPAPDNLFRLQGVGGQFKERAPFTTGYEVLPRDSADIFDIPALLAELAIADTICEGDTVTLSVATTNAGDTPAYAWFRNGTLLPAVTGASWTTADLADGDTVRVEVLATPDVEVEDSLVVVERILDVQPLPEAAITITDNNVLTATPGAFYAWFFNGTLLPNETAQVLTDAQPGFYRVAVTSDEGCTALSDSVEVITVGLRDAFTGQIRVYPNPTHGELTVGLEGAAGTYVLTLRTPLGQAVLRTTTAVGKTTLRLQDQPAGLYYLTIEGPAGQAVRLVQKQ